MKKFLKNILISSFIIFLITPIIGLAQESGTLEKVPTVKAVIGGDKNVVVDRQVLFSSIGSTISGVDNVVYKWEFGDGYYDQGIEVFHVYHQPGVYRASLKVSGYVSGELMQSEDEVIVSVDKEVAILISDNTLTEESFEEIQKIAGSQGVLLVNIQQISDESEYIVEKELSQKIIKSKDDIVQASSIIVWTSKNIGLNAFLEAAQSLNKTSVENGNNLDAFGFSNKYFVVMTDQNFNATGRLSQSLYNLLKPEFIVVTSQMAKQAVFGTTDVQTLLERLRDDNIENKLVGLHTTRELSGFRPWNFLSYFVGYMVDGGMPMNTIYLILVLPIIATVIAFFRQVIGFKALGIYTPSIIAVSFLVTGLKYGIVIFLLTLLVGTFGRLLAKKIRLSYLPRMANLLIAVSFAIFFMFLLGVYFGKTGIIEVSVFPILIMVLLTEKFVAVQIERGNKAAFMSVLETLFLSVICYFLASWQVLRTFVLAYPEIILLTIVINILMGKWTGVRLIEYYRFRKVIKHVELSEKK